MIFSRTFPGPLIALLASCTSSLSPLPEAWKSVPTTPLIRAVEYGDSVSHSPAPQPMSARGEVHVLATGAGQVLMNGTTALTPPFPAIESFDVSVDRAEVAFAARRENNFDIGLVALEGSPIRWMPNDPADEIGVQWAPRGHKISYVIRGKRADFIRTLHIPTSFEFTIDFQNARVHDVAWEPQAERFAVALESIDASDRVEVMKYTGDGRRVAVEPAVKLDVSTEPLGDALLLRPSALRYSEKLPLVVWVTDGDLNRWDDARGALMRGSRVAAAVMNVMPANFWEEAAKIPWIDMSQVYVVDNVGAGFSPPRDGLKPVPTFIIGDAKVRAGHYRKAEQTVAVRPGDVKSFAAAFIADQLKGPDATRHR